MSSQWDEFKDWPIKERAFLAWEKYEEKELLNLLKYNTAVIKLDQESIKNNIKDRHKILKILKNINT
jgi:hypothetical protein